jgi:adenylate cyclase class 2
MDKEIEVRFLEIDKLAMVGKLIALGAKDEGEHLSKETIFYDKELSWKGQGRFLRLRSKNGKTTLTYKVNKEQTVNSAREIEFAVDNREKAVHLFEELGLTVVREIEKYRHTFKLDGVTLDIDSWPKIPPYIEMEGENEAALQDMAKKLGLDWSKHTAKDAMRVHEDVYNVPMSKLHWYTFERVE